MAMSLLERYDEMQRRPFGTNTALSDGSQYGVGGTAGSQFRRQEQSYARALRLLDRQARRGDVGAALKAVDVRGQAMGQGYSPGGIRRKAEADLGLMARVESEGRISEAQRRKAEAEAQQAGMLRAEAAETAGAAPGDADGNGIPDSIQRPSAGGTAGPESFADTEARKRKEGFGATVNPNATPGAGRGKPILNEDEEDGPPNIDPGFTPKWRKGIIQSGKKGIASRWDSYRSRMA